MMLKFGYKNIIILCLTLLWAFPSYASTSLECKVTSYQQAINSGYDLEWAKSWVPERFDAEMDETGIIRVGDYQKHLITNSHSGDKIEFSISIPDRDDGAVIKGTYFKKKQKFAVKVDYDVRYIDSGLIWGKCKETSTSSLAKSENNFKTLDCKVTSYKGAINSGYTLEWAKTWIPETSLMKIDDSGIVYFLGVSDYENEDKGASFEFLKYFPEHEDKATVQGIYYKQSNKFSVKITYPSHTDSGNIDGECKYSADEATKIIPAEIQKRVTEEPKIFEVRDVIEFYHEASKSKVFYSPSNRILAFDMAGYKWSGMTDFGKLLLPKNDGSPNIQNIEYGINLSSSGTCGEQDYNWYNARGTIFDTIGDGYPDIVELYGVKIINIEQTKHTQINFAARNSGGMVCNGISIKDNYNPYNDLIFASSSNLISQDSQFTSAELQPQTQQATSADTQIPLITITRADTDDKQGIVAGRVSDNVGVAEVTVDGNIVPVTSDGSFEYSTYVPATGLSVVVEVTDLAGLSSSQTVTLERNLNLNMASISFDRLNPIAKPAERNSNALALIIGVSDYENTPAKAIFADTDAMVFHDYASEKLGIPDNRIKTLVNDGADEREMLLAVQTWLSRSVKQDQTDVYVFFAGHGLASDDGQNMYLLPYDGSPELLDDTAILRDRLFNDIATANPRSVTVFLDTCYSGSTRGSEMLIAARPILLKAKDSAVPEGFTVFTAAAGDETAKPLEEAKHGMFSYFLMKGMEGDADTNGDKQITAGELHAYVKSNVVQQSSGTQTPELQGDADRVLVRFK